MRLLLVEDDPSLGATVQFWLQLDGYAVDWVQRGDQDEMALHACRPVPAARPRTAPHERRGGARGAARAPLRAPERPRGGRARPARPGGAHGGKHCPPGQPVSADQRVELVGEVDKDLRKMEFEVDQVRLMH